jgi:glycosyltransferase involved in cell wall biosynthesis|tara:strand:+ start:1376 stop:2389 length:1014 start_codon:yes stop_codon:yes gene_type:complete
MSINNLAIVENEKIFQEKNKFYCDNIDAKSIPEGINNFRKIYLIARKSKVKRVQQINLSQVKIGSNIFLFLNLILKTFSEKNINYLLISINPYTFLSALILLLFKKKVFIYLRSSGHEEYKAKYGLFGKLIYHTMYLLVTPWSNLIVCHERLTKKKDYHLVFPSQLGNKWFENLKQVSLDKVRLLYVGRMRVEKGIFDFLKMFNKLSMNAELSIVSDVKNLKNMNKKINLLGFGYDEKSLIEIYDSHNIMVLPSYTEGHPQVVLESLSRKRPVIVFDDIKHIIGTKKGIFISKRNIISLNETIEFIMKNYTKIQENMKENKLPTKEEFILQMNSILT